MRQQNPVATAIGICVAALGLISSAALAQHESPRIEWLSSEAAALQVARQTGRPIVAFVTSDHCGYCRKMDTRTWPNSQVAGAVNTGFVPLRLDAARRPDLVEQLGVRAFPTVLLFAPSGDRLDTVAGYRSPKQLLPLLTEVQRDLQTSRSLAGGQAP